MSPASSAPDTHPADDRAGAVAPGFRLLPWVALVLVAVWIGYPSSWWLAAAAAALVGAILAGWGRQGGRAAGLLLVLSAVVVAYVGQLQVDRLARDFAGYWTRREAEVAGTIERELDGLLESGEGAARALAQLASAATPDARDRALVDLRERTSFAAMALYDATGRLDVWDGVHQGLVPDSVRVGAVPYAYADRPLFSHLYFTEPLPDGRGTAVVAALLRTDLPQALGARTNDFAARVRARTGEEIRLSRAELAAGEGVWDLSLGDRTLFSVAIARPSTADRLERVRDRWARAVGALVLTAWVLLALAGRGDPRDAGASAAALAAVGTLLPLGDVLRSPGCSLPATLCCPVRSGSRSGR
jgi:hypothetical protein